MSVFKSIHRIGAFTVVGLSILAGSVRAGEPAHPPAAKPVVLARVNDVPIYDDEVRASCFNDLGVVATRGMPEKDRKEECDAIMRRALYETINRHLVLCEMKALMKRKPEWMKGLVATAAAKKADECIEQIKANMAKFGLPTGDDEIKQVLEMRGVTLASYRQNIERDYMMREYLRAVLVAKVSRKEIETYYAEHPDEFETTDRVVWHSVFIDADRFPTAEDARRYAAKVRKRAARGDDFLELIKRFDDRDLESIHDGSTRTTVSWDQGGVRVEKGDAPGEIQPPELEPALLTLKAEEVGPVVEVPNGFHVIKVVERQYAGCKPLDDKLRAEIREQLKKQALLQDQKRLFLELRRNAKIEFVSQDSGN
jgi:hypothetical protein